MLAYCEEVTFTKTCTMSVSMIEKYFAERNY